jgi:8-oxo-dGTP pyrophosphatase MutT (NUDIX family)
LDPFLFVVNVEVYLRRGDRCLLIRRGEGMANAAGLLAGVGGKAEVGDGHRDDILEETARREVAEEIGVDLTGVPLSYVESVFFLAGSGRPVINVVFTGELPAGAQPRIVSPEEVAEVLWITAAEAAEHPKCPVWTAKSLRKVFESGVPG